jgi:hypothetical protein
VGVEVFVVVAVYVAVELFVRVGVSEGVTEGMVVEVGLGVNDNAAIACLACTVRATDVEVAFVSGVGDEVPVGEDVWVGGLVEVKVKVGGTVTVSVGGGLGVNVSKAMTVGSDVWVKDGESVKADGRLLAAVSKGIEDEMGGGTGGAENIRFASG